ncbi:MAG TPA: hypothetical protein VK400_01065 [Pyrinomonadaceae bacterium]|nr:hypothetical protein [Pyrinomonadaceae bacterium]
MPEEISKYQTEWDDYKEGNSLGCLLVLIIVPLILLLRYFLPQMPDYFSVILFIVFAFVIFISNFSENDGWKCPRCRQRFDYRKRIVPTKKCVECKLPIYYGSSHFYDYWGTEKGNDLARKIKEGNL